MPPKTPSKSSEVRALRDAAQEILDERQSLAADVIRDVEKGQPIDPWTLKPQKLREPGLVEENVKSARDVVARLEKEFVAEVGKPYSPDLALELSKDAGFKAGAIFGLKETRRFFDAVAKPDNVLGWDFDAGKRENQIARLERYGSGFDEWRLEPWSYRDRQAFDRPEMSRWFSSAFRDGLESTGPVIGAACVRVKTAFEPKGRLGKFSRSTYSGEHEASVVAQEFKEILGAQGPAFKEASDHELAARKLMGAQMKLANFEAELTKTTTAWQAYVAAPEFTDVSEKLELSPDASIDELASTIHRIATGNEIEQSGPEQSQNGIQQL